MLDFRSPLARMQGRGHVQSVMTWLNTVSSMGADAAGKIDTDKAVRFLGDALGVPKDLIRQEVIPDILSSDTLSADISKLVEDADAV